MLTRITVDGTKLLCSDATEDELLAMYKEIRRQEDLDAAEPRVQDPQAFFFHYATVGPREVKFKDRRFILWGSPLELRFYTPEEFEVLQEG